MWADPPAGRDRAELGVGQAGMRHEPTVAAADEDRIGVAVDEWRVEPHPKPPRRVVKIELRAVAHGDAVPTFKIHSDECANTASLRRLDVRCLAKTQRQFARPGQNAYRCRCTVDIRLRSRDKARS